MNHYILICSFLIIVIVVGGMMLVNYLNKRDIRKQQEEAAHRVRQRAIQKIRGSIKDPWDANKIPDTRNRKPRIR